jgi:NAD-dependent histone deacetylase SIR2
MISSLLELTTEAKPTAFHTFLDQISPRLLRVYTQNIDSLENRFESLRSNVPLPTKSPWPKTIQLHGDLNYATCFKCQWVGRLNPEQLTPGAEMGCAECRVADDVRQVVGKRCQGVGIIRPRVVLYNEPNPDAVCRSTYEANYRMRLGLCQMRTYERDLHLI